MIQNMSTGAYLEAAPPGSAVPVWMVEKTNFSSPTKWSLNDASPGCMSLHNGFSYISAAGAGDNTKQVTTLRCMHPKKREAALLEPVVFGELQMWRFEDSTVRALLLHGGCA